MTETLNLLLQEVLMKMLKINTEGSIIYFYSDFGLSEATDSQKRMM